MKTVIVKVAPPLERVRRPGAPHRFYTAAPEQVERTSAVERLIAQGALVETDEAPVAEDKHRVERTKSVDEAKADFQEKVRGR